MRSFVFSIEQMNVILLALQDRPWKEVNHVIQHIHAQVINNGQPSSADAEQRNDGVEAAD
jgi:hypothetical protein